MKNLMTYVNPTKSFGEEEKITVKIQIDNGLDLGWKREDIILATNFPYEYNGIKAIEVSGDHYRPFYPQASKIGTIIDLIEKGFIKPDELYWFHDFDVFQNQVITEAELDLGEADMGLCDKGRMPKWNTGSIFFNSDSYDIFTWIKKSSDRHQTSEENALWYLCQHDTYPYADEGYTQKNIPGLQYINDRVKKINITYNLRIWNIDSTYEMAVKPIRAVQFHPFAQPTDTSASGVDFFMYGKNKINTILMSERLIKIFHEHGIK